MSISLFPRPFPTSLNWTTLLHLSYYNQIHTENGRKHAQTSIIYEFGNNKAERRPRIRWQDEVRDGGRLVGGKGWKEKVYKRGMEEAPESGKESSRSAHANGMNQSTKYILFFSMPIFLSPTLKNFMLIFAPFKCLSKVLFLVLIILHDVFTSPSPVCFATCIQIQFSKLSCNFPAQPPHFKFPTCPP